MADATAQQSGGLGLASVLTIVFVVLKLTGTIAWSWWWVLSPLWISFALWTAIVVLVLLFAVVLGDRR